MAKVDYLKHYKKFQKFVGTLPEYCESRRPKLESGPTRSAFKRIKKRVASGSLEKPRKVRKSTQKRPKADPPKKKKRSLVPTNKFRTPKRRVEHPLATRLISIKHQKVVDKYMRMDCQNQTLAYQSVYKCKPVTAQHLSRKMFARPEVKEYLNYQRSVAASKVQVDLAWINKRRKEIAETELKDVADFGATHLTIKEANAIPSERSSAIKKLIIEKEFKYVPGPDGDMEQIIKVKHGIELEDRQKAMDNLEKSLISKNHDVSAQSTHEEVREAWDMFIKKEINAMEFCYILEKLNCKIPQVIQKQAEAEIRAMQDEGMLIIKEAIPVIEGKDFSVDDQLKIVIKRAAEEGNVNDMMSALKTLAAMKIIKTSFNFSIFSKFARMGFDGETVDPDDPNVIEVEAQKWDE